MQAAGFVLVGGRSSRMGRDKALLRWNSHTLVEYVAAKVRSVAGNVALVGPADRYRALALECLPDIRPALGPLAGIETALASDRAELSLIAACDLPEIETAWLRGLLRKAQETQALCVVLRDAQGTVQPLCGIYRKGCLPIIQRALDERRLRLQNLMPELQASILNIESPLVNLNTPDDWLAWQRSSVARHGG